MLGLSTKVDDVEGTILIHHEFMMHEMKILNCLRTSRDCLLDFTIYLLDNNRTNPYWFAFKCTNKSSDNAEMFW